MDLSPSTDDLAFRADVRSFVTSTLPTDIRDRVLGQKHILRDDLVRWHKALHAKGWGAPSWPVEFGGTGWSTMQRMIFDEECNLLGAPRLLPFRWVLNISKSARR